MAAVVAAVSFSPLFFFFFLLLFLFFPLLSSSAIAHSRSKESSDEDDGSRRRKGSMSVLISQKGLDFAMELLVDRVVPTLTPLRLHHDINKSFSLPPAMGGVLASLSNITLTYINVSSSRLLLVDEDEDEKEKAGLVKIVASGITANLSMDWYYSCSSWLLPFAVSDRGTARLQVGGMEVGLTMNVKNQEQILKLTAVECDCYVKDIFITLEGGSSWFYQGQE